MKKRLMDALWGDMKGEELKKFIILAVGMFLIIGSYWPLKALKDSIFINLIGAKYLPKVKTLSVIICLILVLFYSRLVEYFSKEKIIYLLVSFYSFVGLVLVYYLNHPVMGLQNPETGPHRWIGWAFYLFVESYIVLVISSFWAFINDITVPDSAKKGYGLLTFGTQFGGFSFMLLGTFLSHDTSQYAHSAPLIALISVLMLACVNFVVLYLKRNVSKSVMEGYEEHAKHEEHDKLDVNRIRLLDGMKVIFKYPYVAGIFSILFLQELIGAILGFQLSLLVESTFGNNSGMVNKFLFDYALAVQGVTCLFSFVGTSYFMRKFGVTFCLVSFPILLGVLILGYTVHPTLTMIFYVMVISKMFNYGLNTPAKEVLYIPTTREIKYKSKAWIDMFGLRLAKFFGFAINDAVGPVVIVTGGIALGIAAIWTVSANLTGKTFKKAVDENKLIG